MVVGISIVSGDRYVSRDRGCMCVFWVGVI